MREMKKQKSWKKYEVNKDGWCSVVGARGSSGAWFEIGIVETGRSRVFAGYFVSVMLFTGQKFIGEDSGRLRKALENCNADCLNKGGFFIAAAGRENNFKESGLSLNSGWGYVPDDFSPVHMMEPSMDAYLKLAFVPPNEKPSGEVEL